MMAAIETTARTKVAAVVTPAGLARRHQPAKRQHVAGVGAD
jgi:hypothetical protein